MYGVGGSKAIQNNNGIQHEQTNSKPIANNNNHLPNGPSLVLVKHNEQFEIESLPDNFGEKLEHVSNKSVEGNGEIFFEDSEIQIYQDNENSFVEFENQISSEGRFSVGKLFEKDASSEIDGLKSPKKDKNPLERALGGLAKLISNLRVRFDNFQFKVSEYFAKEVTLEPSRNVTEATIDRKHALLDKSNAPGLQTFHQDGLEPFAQIKWTGDKYKDSKLFQKISNQLTKLEDSFRLDYGSKENTVKSLRNEISVLKELPPSEENLQKIQEKERKISDVKLETFLPQHRRESVAHDIVSSSSDLHLSEVSVEDLEVLFTKFTEVGHSSKASFVRALITELGGRQPTASQEELKQMRKDRDEEIKAGFKPDIDYKTVRPVGQFKGSVPQISLNLRKMLSDLKSDHADIGQNPDSKDLEKFTDDKLEAMVKKASVGQIKEFDVERMGKVAAQLRKDGLGDRANLLEKITAKVENLQSQKGNDDSYRPVAMNGLAEAKDPTTFLRSGSDPVAVAMASLMNKVGMENFRQKVLKLAIELCKELNGKTETTELINEMKSKEVKGWNTNMTDTLARGISKIAIRLQQEIAELGFDTGVKNLFGEFSNKFLDRTTVDENVDPKLKGDGLTNNEKNIFIHKVFADQLFLKVINPVLTSGLTLARDKDIPKEMLSLMSMVAAFSQGSANQKSLKDPKTSGEDIYPNVVVEGSRDTFRKDMFDASVTLANLQDEMFKNAGMRPEATSKNILNLPVIEQK